MKNEGNKKRRYEEDILEEVRVRQELEQLKKQDLIDMRKDKVEAFPQSS
jgi:hypothetical protein